MMKRENLHSILFITFLLIFSSFASANWPTYQHDIMNTGHVEENLSPHPKVLWVDNSTDFGGGFYPSFAWNTPIYADGKLFIVDALGYYLYSINASNGKMIWRCNIFPGKYTYSAGAPAYSNNTVFAAVSSYNKPFFGIPSYTYLYAINATTGEIKWKTILHGLLGLKTSVKIYKNRIILGTSLGRNLPFGILYMIDAGNGKILWEKFVIGAIVGSACVYSNRIYVAAYGQLVPFFIAHRLGGISAIYCFDMKGRLKWMKFVIGQAKASVTASYGMIYFESLHYFNKIKSLAGEIIYALNATTGKMEWKKEEIMEEYPWENDQFTDIAVAYGKIFFNGWTDSFCLDAFTGNIIWHINHNFYGEAIFPSSPPAVCGNYVYIAAGIKIKVVNASDGKVISNIKLPYAEIGYGGGFAIADGKIFRATFAGYIYALG